MSSAGAPSVTDMGRTLRVRDPVSLGVVLACAATLVVHGMLLTRELDADEGGYAMVARFWGSGGHYLYGPSWVDRPPLLIAVFGLADLLGPYGVRILATVVAVLLVASVAWTVRAVGDRTAETWGAWTAFALSSSTLLDAQTLDGEIISALWVTVCMGCGLRALRTARSAPTAAGYGVAAALTGVTAVLTKQNFVDGLVFCGVLGLLTLAVGRHRRDVPRFRAVGAVLGFGSGLLAAATAALVWGATHGGLRAWGYALLGFRRDAAGVATQDPSAGAALRAQHLLVVGVVSGLLLLLGYLAVVHARRLLRPDPLPWALACQVVVELAGILAGLHYWSHYPLALVPSVSLAAGLAAQRFVRGWRGTRLLVVFAAVVTAVVSTTFAVHAAITPSASYTTGRWIAASAQPGDTVVVPFSHPSVVDATGLRPAYPYAWWLPARILDPHHHLLRTDLVSPRVGTPVPPTSTAHFAPTWVVMWNSVHPSAGGHSEGVGAALRAHYHPVAQLCQHTIWLHDGVQRVLAPLPGPGQCGRGMH